MNACVFSRDMVHAHLFKKVQNLRTSNLGLKCVGFARFVCFSWTEEPEKAEGKEIIAKGLQLRMSTLTRGHFLPLRLTIPPLRTLLSFACSVASLSRCPSHYPPGHHSLRRAALAECPLGQGKPSTRPEGHDESTYTSQTSFHSDDRRTWPLPADEKVSSSMVMMSLGVVCGQCTLLQKSWIDR